MKTLGFRLYFDVEVPDDAPEKDPFEVLLSEGKITVMLPGNQFASTEAYQVEINNVEDSTPENHPGNPVTLLTISQQSLDDLSKGTWMEGKRPCAECSFVTPIKELDSQGKCNACSEEDPDEDEA